MSDRVEVVRGQPGEPRSRSRECRVCTRSDREYWGHTRTGSAEGVQGQTVSAEVVRGQPGSARSREIRQVVPSEYKVRQEVLGRSR